MPYPRPVDLSKLKEMRLSFIPVVELHAPHSSVKPLMVSAGTGIDTGVTVMSIGTKFASLGFSM